MDTKTKATVLIANQDIYRSLRFDSFTLCYNAVRPTTTVLSCHFTLGAL